MRYSILLLFWSFICCGGSAKDEKTDSGAPIRAVASTVNPVGREPVDMLMGKFSPEGHDDFVLVNAPYTAKQGMYMRKAAFEAFANMWRAAKKDDISLLIISSTRTFEQQKVIWEGKWGKFAQQYPDDAQRALKILEYSSMPGSSRHHWGTDIDLNDLNNEAFEGKGKHRKVYEWLVAHAHEYGFGQPYTPKGPERPYGYNEEKWHWSYLPLAKSYLADYTAQIDDGKIAGFKGADTAKAIQITQRYVGGVAQACK